MIDTHTHTAFSADSTESPDKLILSAIDKGIKYLAITDHVDRDYLYGNIRQTRQIVMEEYYPAIIELKEKYKGRIIIGVGAEFGYTKQAIPLYKEITVKYPDLDIIINSVHTIKGDDAYFPEFFTNIDKVSAYKLYLEAILESLSVNYDFDIISHLGYITRNAPYPDKALYYDEFRELIDQILITIISKHKALEINTRSASHNSPFMPSKEIIIRYKELGGELISFGSDAHKAVDVGNGYKTVKDFLTSLGYRYITSFIKHKPIMNEL